MQGKAWAAMVAAAGYVAIMAAGMAVSWHGFGYRYGDPQMMRVLIWVEVVLAAYAVWAAGRLHGGWSSGFDRLDRRGLWWMAPHLGVILAMAAMLVPAVSGSLGTAVLVVATTLLVGFSEEVMFRGVVLRGMLGAVRRGWAIVIAAACFAALHAVNVLAGLPVGDMALQLGLTFVFGLAFGALALRLGSLWPLIAFHAAWDMLLFLGGLYGVGFGPLSLLGIAANAVVGVLVWVLVLRRGVSSSAR